MTDCGYRHPKRLTHIGVANEDSCTVAPTTSDDALGGSVELECTDERCEECLDHTDDIFTLHPIKLSANATCGRGTQAKRCEKLLDAEMMRIAALDATVHNFAVPPRAPGDAWTLHGKHDRSKEPPTTPEDMRGSYLYTNLKYRPRTIYINSANVGSGPCEPPRNLFRGTTDAWDSKIWTPVPEEVLSGEASTYEENAQRLINRVCSDSGAGSVRLPLQSPNANWQTQFYYDFVCPYGSQAPLATALEHPPTRTRAHALERAPPHARRSFACAAGRVSRPRPLGDAANARRAGSAHRPGLFGLQQPRRARL